MPQITAVTPGSPAFRAGLLPRMNLVSVNGHAIHDVLDYRFYTYDRKLTLVTDGGTFALTHAEGGDIGLSFESYLMDKPRSCRNHCVFCFIDQQPKGLRDTLYFKDDDARLSFLTGNYITLTNLTGDDIARIIRQRISPLRVSVHATDSELRRKLLGNPGAGDVMELLRRLAAGNIAIHAQIVVCAGLNDGERLTETLTALDSLGDALLSVSVVPVGLTRYREGLYPLSPVTDAADIIRRASGFRRVYCADELFDEIPPAEYYGDYPQLENGVGMVRDFIDSFSGEVEDASYVTGVAFEPFLEKLVAPRKVFAIRNGFWGERVTAAGLVVGTDIIAQLKGRELGAKLVLPSTMLRHGGDLFLDGLTPRDVARELGVEVVIKESL
ncbi:hypothetical protein FACS1894202_04880 [Clostridia bacterium]|nr:hypothetical protein FACS1894202_04880 [Clostridia bacterium]